MAEPGTRRLYSNAGFDVLAETLAKASGIPFAQYAAEAVFQPLGMAATSLDTAHRTPAGAGGVSTVADLVRFAAELQAPRLLDASTVAGATREVAFPGLNGVLPGFGHCKPERLGPRLRDPRPASRRTGPARPARRGPSGTSASPAPSCGWTRPPARPASR